ncbi:MAG: hypothetical protein CL745_03475 [Chloroflexi bacterium]|nr:hypothetical protein [Chloroflexota bacterium]|tara:strand:- start:1043 stop:1999 length:957 start_codon:yes stop_codon:yes gene_type:complete
MNILTVIINENKMLDEASLEIFSFIDDLEPSNKITTLVFGGEKSIISNLPSDEIFYVSIDKSEELNPNSVLQTIDKFTNEKKFDLIIFQKDDISNYVAPSLSFRKDFSYLPDVKKFVSKSEREIKFVRPVHGESAEAIYSVDTDSTIVIKIRKSSFEAKSLGDHSNSVNEIILEKSLDSTFKIIETIKVKPEGIQLDEADIVISGGRGIGSKEGFDNLKKLATLLNGAVGASRAAVESEWIETSHLVGLTGKWISPALYFTFGISGASQHLAGCINSKNIVAVNTDPDASIFNHSKFGVVADCNDFIKEVIEEIKNIQ